MNRKQLTLLFVALVVVGAAGLILMKSKESSWSAPQGKMGQELFPNFPINDVAAIHLKGTGESHLTNNDGSWRVQERGGYPASSSQVRELLMKMYGLKISQSEPIGASQLGRMDLEPPGKGTNSGTLMEFADKSGKPLDSLLLGKKHMQESARPSPYGGGGYPDARYVLLPGDSGDLLLVSDALDSVESNPESWLDRDFFKVEKVQSVALVSTNATNSWKLSRDTETAPWVLTGLKPGEMLDSNKVSSLASTLSYASFVDVASNNAPAVTGLDKPLTVSFTTFDHFTYDIKIGGKTPENNYYLTVATAADLSTNRVAGKDEKPEEKTKLDKEFADKLKEQQDKLTKEKALANWVYVVNSGQVDPLIRDRSQLMEEKKEEKPAGTNAPDMLKPPTELPSDLNFTNALPVHIPK